MNRYKAPCLLRQFSEERQNLLCPKRTVYPYRQQICMGYRCKKSLDCLSRQRPSAPVGYGKRQHYRQSFSARGESLLRRIKSALCIKSVENRFEKEQIHPSFNQSRNLLAVSLEKSVVPDAPRSGVFHVRRNRATFVGRADAPGHISWLFRRREPSSSLRCNFGSLPVYLLHIPLCSVIGHADRRGIERVGLYNVGSRFEICRMNIVYDIRVGKNQNIVIPFKLELVVGKSRTSEPGFTQTPLLNHGTHGSVQNQNPVFQKFLYIRFVFRHFNITYLQPYRDSLRYNLSNCCISTL